MVHNPFKALRKETALSVHIAQLDFFPILPYCDGLPHTQFLFRRQHLAQAG